MLALIHVAYETTGATNTMTTLLSSLQEVFTQGITNIGTIATTIVGQPLLLLTVGMLFAGFCLKFFGKLLRNS